MKNIVITGVSTGIGYSATKILIENGYRVFGSVRKQQDSDQLKEEFGENFHPLVFDVRDEVAIKDAASIVENIVGGDGIDCLINNSGIALGGPSLHLPTEVFKEQFEVNLFGVVSVTNIFSKLLGAYKGSLHSGKIIMISSVSGKRSYPFVGPYTASKHALEGYSDALRRELMLYDIDVILVEPGPIKTAIWDKAPSPDDNPFLGTDYEDSLRIFYKQVVEKGKQGLESDSVGRLIKKIIELRKPKTRYVISANKLRDYYLPGLLSDRLFDKIFAKVLKLRKRFL
tara:strand:- start:376 stop:1230 length:855 start_codon:yes stop_codon:yes gene_type:complete